MFRPSGILFQMGYCGHMEETGRARRKTQFESSERNKIKGDRVTDPWEDKLTRFVQSTG